MNLQEVPVLIEVGTSKIYVTFREKGKDLNSDIRNLLKKIYQFKYNNR